MSCATSRIQRTSVMTHMAWVPQGWTEVARKTLEGMAERHPSRTLLLIPYPDTSDRIDACAYLQSFRLPELNRSVSTEVVAGQDSPSHSNPAAASRQGRHCAGVTDKARGPFPCDPPAGSTV